MEEAHSHLDSISRERFGIPNWAGINETAALNPGVLDQRLGLEWVRDGDYCGSLGEKMQDPYLAFASDAVNGLKSPGRPVYKAGGCGRAVDQHQRP